MQNVFHAQHCTQAPAQQQASPIFKRLPSAPSSHNTNRCAEEVQQGSNGGAVAGRHRSSTHAPQPRTVRGHSSQGAQVHGRSQLWALAAGEQAATAAADEGARVNTQQLAGCLMTSWGGHLGCPPDATEVCWSTTPAPLTAGCPARCCCCSWTLQQQLDRVCQHVHNSSMNNSKRQPPCPPQHPNPTLPNLT